MRETRLKIVVVGGTGLIGSRLVRRLQGHALDAVTASPRSGVDTVTGEGLAAELEGAEVVIDVSNPPSVHGEAAWTFFTTSTRNLLEAGAAAGVRHHVALSIVGTDRLIEGDYFRAKLAQEATIRGGSIPYSIVRATQFFEFLGTIANAATEGEGARLAPISIQPIAAEDVAGALAGIALGPPINAVAESAGPERFRVDELIRRYLQAIGDERVVITDPGARYFGVTVEPGALLPGPDAKLGTTRFEDWIRASAR